MSAEERREVAGLIVQAIMAETLAALRVGKMEGNREPWLTWQGVPVDAGGEQEIAELMQDTYDKVDDIKVRNAHRLAEACASAQKEGRKHPSVARTEIVALLSFERSPRGAA